MFVSSLNLNAHQSHIETSYTALAESKQKMEDHLYSLPAENTEDSETVVRPKRKKGENAKKLRDRKRGKSRVGAT